MILKDSSFSTRLRMYPIKDPFSFSMPTILIKASPKDRTCKIENIPEHLIQKINEEQEVSKIIYTLHPLK